MRKADGIVIGSPTYFWGPTPEIKSLIGRVGYIARGPLRSGDPRTFFYRKIGGAITTDRRGGAVHIIQAIQALLYTTQMIVPGTSYWTFGISFGNQKGDVGEDKEGVQAIEGLGTVMAWLIKNLPKNS